MTEELRQKFMRDFRNQPWIVKSNSTVKMSNKDQQIANLQLQLDMANNRAASYQLQNEELQRRCSEIVGSVGTLTALRKAASEVARVNALPHDPTPEEVSKHEALSNEMFHQRDVRVQLSERQTEEVLSRIYTIALGTDSNRRLNLDYGVPSFQRPGL